MPKIIKDAKKQILQAAKEELQSSGIKSLSMRSVAKKADVAVGTIYHYFPDKINLVVGILYEDWVLCLSQAKRKLEKAKSIKTVCSTIVSMIKDFTNANSDTFDNYKSTSFSGIYFEKHQLFLEKIKELWVVGKTSLHLSADSEQDELISEMLIATSKSNLISVMTLSDAIMKLLNGGNQNE